MLKLLKAVVARLLGRYVARLLGRSRRPLSGPPHDADPYAGVRQPLRRGPSAGHAAAAVMEPEPEALPPGPVTADGLQILRRSDGSPEYSQLLIRRILRTSIGDFHANSVRTKLASNSRRSS